MTTSVKCRAKDPATCNDPNCPEKRAQLSEFYNSDGANSVRAAVLKMAGGASKLDSQGEKDGYNLIFDMVDEASLTDVSKQELVDRVTSFYRSNRHIKLIGYKAGMRRAIKALKRS